MKKEPIFAGVDAGSSRIKLVLIDYNKKIVGSEVVKSGVDFTKGAELCFRNTLKKAGISEDMVACTVSTGYGRKNVSFAYESKTEISCHAKGCYHFFPRSLNIIDIGGQDNKIIKIDETGRRIGFKMNRKCSAGTGAFLEEMSMRLDIPLEGMDSLARDSKETVILGSFCTVFSATEVLQHIRNGVKTPDIVKGLFLSVIKRVLEMDQLTEHIAMTGGVVEHNRFIIQMTSEIIGRPVLTPKRPQLTGALGAALYAQDIELKRSKRR